MPSSTISLESLSSPSPSPSPPPPDTHTTTSNHSGGGAGLDSDSELSELTEDEQENDKNKATREERPRPPRRGRKRGGIVPAPMWDWAYKSNKKDTLKPKAEEEEEEELAGPAKAMEEEEDDEQEERSQTGVSSLHERRTKRGAVKGATLDDEDPDTTHNPTSGAPTRDDNTHDLDVLSEDEEGDGVADGEDDDARPDDGGGPSQDGTDDENAEDEDGDVPIEDDRPEDDEDADENAPVESEDDAEDPSSVPVSTPATTHASRQPIEPSAEPEPDAEKMEVDVPTPGTEQRSPIIAAVAASSIMAGSSVIRPPSPTPSASSAEGSTRKRTPADSRSPSPEVPSDHEKRAPPRSRTRARNGRSTRTRNRRKAKTELVVEPALDADQLHMDEHDVEGEDAEDNAELEMESDLQPAHRAEALDVLATIELKYALLRERLYVEKMEGLAWEEALVLEGIHPEMLHLHTELSKRRDKRLELAARRRDYEIVNLTKRRKLDEEAVWSWWKYRRDELQTTMIAETNRKKRKLDRERRALDRPPPVRRIPSPPNEVPVAPSLRELVKNNPFDSPEARRRQLSLSSLAYPQLSMLSPADIINDVEFLNGQRRMYDSVRSGMMGVNPVIGHHAVGPAFDQFNMGVGMMDGSGLSNRPPQQIPFQSSFQPPPPNQIMPVYIGPGPAAAPRLQHHHSAPPGTVPNTVHSQMLLEQDVGPIRRPASGITQFPGPSAPLMPRSVSPMPLQPSTLSATALAGKPNGWMGPAGLSSANLASSSKESMRLGGGMRPVEVEALDREKERERMADALKMRERAEWEWDREREREQREREMECEKERDRDRDHEQDHDLEGPNQTPALLQRQQHAHSLISPGQVITYPSHHHHRHHHHVHHHHHLQQGPNAPSLSPPVLPSQVPNGSSVDRSSPIIPRELEGRRPSGDMPMEGVEPLPAVKSVLPSPMSSLWKGPDDVAPPADFARDRGRSIIPPAQERNTTPFVLTPSQASMAMQANPSPSPRNVAGPSTAPASMGPSRRGSWSAPDDNGIPLPRPSSSGSTHVGNNPSGPPSHLHPSAGLSGKRLQSSPLMQSQGPRSPLIASPPHSNGIRLPPLSPSTSAIVRSPARVPLPLPLLSSSTTGQPKSLSPKVLRRSPPPPGRPKSPGREQLNNPDAGPMPAPIGKARPVSPLPIFPGSPSIPPSLSAAPRLSSVNAGSDPNLPPLPQTVPS